MAETIIDRTSLDGNPRDYRLALRVQTDCLHAMFYKPDEPESTVYRRVPLLAYEGEMERRLEDVIYDNPVLLSDFDAVTVIADTLRYSVIPTAIARTPGLVDAMSGELLHSNVDIDETVVNVIADECDDALLWSAPAKFTAFLRRTFNNPLLLPHIAILMAYARLDIHPTRAPKLHINLRPGAVDIVAATASRFDIASTFTFRDPADAAYYVLACRAMLADRDGLERELSVGGDKVLRSQVSDLLSRFVNFVMPASYPSSPASYPAEAMKAPFDLLILPLCE